MYYVYILKLSNNTYYTGFTNNLERRFQEHQTGNSNVTKRYLPIKLVLYIAFDTKVKAQEFESYLKSGSGIAFRNKHFV